MSLNSMTDDEKTAAAADFAEEEQAAKQLESLVYNADEEIQNCWKRTLSDEPINKIDKDDNFSLCLNMSAGEKLETDIALQVVVQPKKRLQSCETKRLNNETQMNVHRVNVICLVSHLNHLNRCLQNSLLQAVALSLIPQSVTVASASFSRDGLIKFLVWFGKTFFVKQNNADDIPLSLESTLFHSMNKDDQNVSVDSPIVLVLLFILMARSLGWFCRLILNLHTVPLKIKKEQEVTSSVSERKTSNCSRKRNYKGSKIVKKNLDESTSFSTFNYWSEISVDSMWNCVAVNSCCKLMDPQELIKHATEPIRYVISVDNSGYFKDVTLRYTMRDYYTLVHRQRRIDLKWLTTTLDIFNNLFSFPIVRHSDILEDKELKRQQSKLPLPSTINELKNHPLYVLQRHILKLEVIYPPNASPVGYLNGEAIYERVHIKTLRSRHQWLKDGRIIKPGEEPLKSSTTFGEWQTMLSIPPAAVNGIVPKNEYGNVELFKTWMLPKGTIHIPIDGIWKTAQILNIDYAKAMVGWDFHKGICHPAFNGIVVCSEFEDAILDAWNKDAVRRNESDENKRSEKALKNWKRIIRGASIRAKLLVKYGHNN